MKKIISFILALVIYLTLVGISNSVYAYETSYQDELVYPDECVTLMTSTTQISTTDMTWGILSRSISEGKTEWLNLLYGGNGTVEFEVENENIIKVTDSFREGNLYKISILGLKKGKTKLTAVSSEGKTAVLTIEVINLVYIEPIETTATISQKITWGLPYILISTGEQARLMVYPTGDYKITCKAEDEDILKVDEPIKYDEYYIVLITALNCGETKLIAYSSDGQEAVCVVNVDVETTDITTTASHEIDLTTTAVSDVNFVETTDITTTASHETDLTTTAVSDVNFVETTDITTTASHETDLTTTAVSDVNFAETTDITTTAISEIDSVITTVVTEEMELPQTGNNSITKILIAVAAIILTVAGAGAVYFSGILCRKNDEQ